MHPDSCNVLPAWHDLLKIRAYIGCASKASNQCWYVVMFRETRDFMRLTNLQRCFGLLVKKKMAVWNEIWRLCGEFSWCVWKTTTDFSAALHARSWASLCLVRCVGGVICLFCVYWFVWAYADWSCVMLTVCGGPFGFVCLLIMLTVQSSWAILCYFHVPIQVIIILVFNDFRQNWF